MTTSTTKWQLCSRCKASLGISHVGQINFPVILGRSLDEATLDAQATISEILAATIANLFIPNTTRTFVVKPSDNSSPFSGSVDTNATILIVSLSEVERVRGAVE